MNIMRRLFGTAILIMGCCFVTPIPAAGVEGMVEVRQTMMVSVAAHMRSLGAVAKGNMPFTKTSQDHALSIVRISNVLSLLFPQGSHGGKSHATEEVWSEPAEFERKLKEFKEAATQLLLVVQNGEEVNVGPSLQAVGSTCSGCHNVFRHKHTH